MKNKSVGFLITGIALIMGFLVLLFNLGLRKIVAQTCSHGPDCSMYGTIAIQTYVGLGLTAFVIVIGLFLIFSNYILYSYTAESRHIENMRCRKCKRSACG